MAEKILNTRIQLKYDTLANWHASAFNGDDASKWLKSGEVAIVTLAPNKEENPEATAGQHPLLFKVGTGNHKFDSLPWASALAADVYDWAKAPVKPSYTATEISGLEEFIAGEIQDTNDNTTYDFAIVDGKLQVTATPHALGVAGTPVVTSYDFVTPEELTTILAGYKAIQEAKSGTLTGAQVVASWSQDEQGVVGITTRDLTPEDIGAVANDGPYIVTDEDGVKTYEIIEEARANRGEQGAIYGPTGFEIFNDGAYQTEFGIQLGNEEATVYGDEEGIVKEAFKEFLDLHEEITLGQPDNDDGVRIDENGLTGYHISGNSYYRSTGLQVQGNESVFAIDTDTAGSDIVVTMSEDVIASFNEKLGTEAIAEAAAKKVDDKLVGYKTKQTAVVDPTADGETLAFIDSIAQNANGEITATKKTVKLGEYAKTAELKNDDKAADGQVVVAVPQANGIVAPERKAIEVAHADGQIYLTINGKKIGTGFSDADFVKDGFLSKVDKDIETNEIVFTWNTDAGLTETRIDIDELVEVYTGDETSIHVEDFEISIKDDGVTTGKIADKAVTTEKINDNAVTAAKIADKAVTEAKLANDVATKLNKVWEEVGVAQTLINGLDVTVDGMGKGKTLATLTETDGKIAATFQNIEITSSQISDLDTGVHAVSLASGTNNGTVKLTVDGKPTDNIAVTGLKSAAFIDEKNLKIGQDQVTGLTEFVDNTNLFIEDHGELYRAIEENKADKVTSATAGNFAGLDAEGNLTDSGAKAADFATAAQGAKADTAVQPEELAAIAKTGNVNDLIQTEGDILVFNCGSASTVI